VSIVWNEHNLAHAKALYLSGLSAEEVAKKLGATKGQVIGRAYHLGWIRPRKAAPIRHEHSGAWTEERAQRVKALWLEGKSATQISRLVAEPNWKPSRNTIIGKVHRMGCMAEGRAQPSKPMRAPAVSRSLNRLTVSAANKIRHRVSAATGLPVGEPIAATRPRQEAYTPLPGTTPVPWIERKGWQCCWPVGGEGADTLYCGSRSLSDSMWCETHHRMGHAPTRSASDLARGLRRHIRP